MIQRVYALIESLLDEFDRLLGRNSVEPIDFTPVCEAMTTA